MSLTCLCALLSEGLSVSDPLIPGGALWYACRAQRGQRETLCFPSSIGSPEGAGSRCQGQAGTVGAAVYINLILVKH